MAKIQRRKFPPHLTRDLPTALAEAHDQALKDRNQHVGHRVNDGERVVISAVSQVQGGPVVGLALGSVRLMHPQNHGALRDIAKELHRRLLPVLEREREALLQYLELRNDT